MSRELFYYSTGALLGLAVGTNIGIAVTKDKEDAQGRVAEVQRYNHDLQPQLEKSGRLVAQLVLRDRDNQEYRFRSEGPDGSEQMCEGEYKVADGQAVPTGDLSCTTSEKIAGQ